MYYFKEYKPNLEQSGPAAERSSTSLDVCGHRKPPLILPVPKNYFKTKGIEAKGMTLTEFWKTHKLRTKKLNVFLEVSQMVQKPVNVRDVLLMDKVSQCL